MPKEGVEALGASRSCQAEWEPLESGLLGGPGHHLCPVRTFKCLGLCPAHTEAGLDGRSIVWLWGQAEAGQVHRAGSYRLGARLVGARKVRASSVGPGMAAWFGC